VCPLAAVGVMTKKVARDKRERLPKVGAVQRARMGAWIERNCMTAKMQPLMEGYCWHRKVPKAPEVKKALEKHYRREFGVRFVQGLLSPILAMLRKERQSRRRRGQVVANTGSTSGDSFAVAYYGVNQPQ